MDIDLILAFAHHLAVFVVVGIVAAEFTLLRPGLTGARLSQLARIDRAYGGAAMLLIAVGVGRVLFGQSGAGYYLANQIFWGKMGLFVIVGLLSIQPTMALIGWSRALKADAGFVVPEGQIATSRRFIHLQIIGLALIPLLAAAMARGYGI
jgi:putative membrane protein